MRYLYSLLIFLCLSAGAAEIQIPALTSPVMDEAAFLSEAERNDLSQLAYEINAHQGPQITILTVKDLQENPIEEFSIRVAEKWQLGTKEKGNGLLIIIAKTERQMRIEVGQGIEGEITDFEANKYIREVLTPAFREGEFHAGLKTVLLDVAQKFNLKLEEGSRYVRRATRSRALPGPLVAAFPFLIGVLILGQILLNKRPVARGLFTGAGMAGVGFFVGAAGFAILILMFIVGGLVGLIGLQNLLYAFAAGSGRGGYGGGGGFGGSGGGGSWGGGGGGFSGGGSSGSW